MIRSFVSLFFVCTIFLAPTSLLPSLPGAAALGGNNCFAILKKHRRQIKKYLLDIDEIEAVSTTSARKRVESSSSSTTSSSRKATASHKKKSHSGGGGRRRRRGSTSKVASKKGNNDNDLGWTENVSVINKNDLGWIAQVSSL